MQKKCTHLDVYDSLLLHIEPPLGLLHMAVQQLYRMVPAARVIMLLPCIEFADRQELCTEPGIGLGHRVLETAVLLWIFLLQVEKVMQVVPGKLAIFALVPLRCNKMR